MLASIASFALTIGIAAAVDCFTGGRVGGAEFIACCALWWGIRAWYRQDEVNTAHKISEEE
jgi:hypothetical protein